ncbi:50S ribosomal protein L24 [Rhodobacteraceae bacterium NNCM2]|nr:50S ribosomal protein L24 [Coraliihabitans acroporae]
MAAKLKKGDRVVVIAGRDKGKEGEITQVMPADNRAIVSGCNMVVRHRRQSQQQQGGRISIEAPIQLSNIALVDPKEGGPTRVGFRMEDGQKVRYAKKSGETLDA